MDTIPSIFTLSAGAAIIAVIGFFIVHRVFKPINLEEHSQFLDAMLNIVGTLVSILLGLLVAAALDHYQSLDESVDTEAASVAEVFRLSSGLPEEAQIKIRQLALDYSTQVLNEDWPAMEKGESSKNVTTTLVKLTVVAAKFQPDNDGESNLHQMLLTSIQEIGDCRRKRLLALHSNWTQHLMPLLLTCSAIVMAFAYLYARRGAIFHGVLISFVAIALGGNLGLVFILRNPFSGDWKIKPRGFELNSSLIKLVQSDPELRKLMEVDKKPKAATDKSDKSSAKSSKEKAKDDDDD